jgi:hypothetical protein
MNLASVSTISYADSNDGIFLLVGSLGCIKPEILGLSKKVKFRERARNFYRKLIGSGSIWFETNSCGAKLGTEWDTAILQQGTGDN